MRRAAATRWLLLALLSLGACGAPSQDDERDAVRAAIEGALTSTDPKACTEPYTQAFLDQGAFGLRALADEVARFCAANVGSLAARSVRISRIAIDGDQARGDFNADGGGYAVRAATVALRRQGGRWRLDRLLALELDRARFAEQQARAARLADDELSAAQAGCLARRLGRVADQDLQRAIVDADPGVLADPLLVCAIRPQLRAEGLSSMQARCVILELRRGPGQLARNLLDRTDAARRERQRAFRRAGERC